MFQRILLASDGSAHAYRAAEKSIALASVQENVKIDILYVVDGNTSKVDVLHSNDIAKSRKEKLKPTEEAIAQAGISFETKIIHGEPGPEIVKYSKNNDIDLIIIGSRGLNSLQEMVLGSVSHKVAKRAACPVMIIK